MVFGDLIKKVVGAFIDAIFTLFEAIANAIAGPVKNQIAEPFLATLLYTPTPRYCPGGGAIETCPNPKPALLTKPANSPWGEVWDLYWGKFFVAALFIGLTLYIMTNFISSIPWVSPQLRKRLRGGYVKLLVLLPMGWPIVVISLFLIDGLNHLIAPNPDRFAFLLSSIITSMIAAAASPFAVVTAIISMVDILLLIIAFALFFFRILFMIAIVVISPLLIMGLTLDIPLVKSLGKTLFSQWAKIGLAPMAVGGCYKVTALLITSPDGSGGYTYDGLGIWGGTAQIVSLTLGMVIPLVGLFGFYILLQARVPAGANRAISSIQSRAPNTKVGDLGETRKSDRNVRKSAWRKRIDNTIEGYEARRSSLIDENIQDGIQWSKGRAGKAKKKARNQYGNFRSNNSGGKTTSDDSSSSESVATGTPKDISRDRFSRLSSETDYKVATALNRDPADSEDTSVHHAEVIDEREQPGEVIDLGEDEVRLQKNQPDSVVASDKSNGNGLEKSVSSQRPREGNEESVLPIDDKEASLNTSPEGGEN